MSEFIEVPASSMSITKRKLIHGVAANDALYMVNFLTGGKLLRCPYYDVWKNLIQRAYSDKFRKKRPCYANVTICKEWLSFSNFKAWMEAQDWKGKDLDKDIIKIGNKHYSPDNCRFVAGAINRLVLDRVVGKGLYPTGVNWDKRSSKFQSKVTRFGKIFNLGLFSTAEEAALTYRKAKSDHIRKVAANQTDPAIRQGLIRHADALMVATA